MSVLKLIADIANSQFLSSLTGALAGAFAGAYAAQKIATIAIRRAELTREIRQVNAAISVAYTVFNGAVAAKRQHVAKMLSDFKDQKLKVLHQLETISRTTAQEDTVIEFRAEMLALPQLRIPGEPLRSIVFEQLSATGRELALASTIAQVTQSLDEALEKRNLIIANLRQLPRERASEFAHRFFGIEHAEEGVDTEYEDLLFAISRYIDDLLFVSKLLTEDLRLHGLSLVKELKEFSGTTELRISEIVFDDPRVNDLMPNPGEYNDWLQSFKKPSD